MKGKLVILIVFLSVLILDCKEQNKTNQGTNNQNGISLNEKDVDNIRQVVMTLYKAMVDRDAKRLNELCGDKLTYGHSTGVIQNKAEFIDDIVTGSFDYLSIVGKDQTIMVTGNTAIVRDTFSAKASKDGDLIDLKICCIQVYEKKLNNAWKLIARQGYKI